MPKHNINHSDAAFRAIREARRKFGQARFELGIYLEHVRQTEAWKARNDTFAQFLEEERINESAAYQYMRVARRFLIELQVREDDLNELVMVNISTLDLAARVATPENLDDVLALVTTLSERDAKAELETMEPSSTIVVRPRKEPRVEKVLRLYRELADDQRIDVKNTLRVNTEQKDGRAAG